MLWLLLLFKTTSLSHAGAGDFIVQTTGDSSIYVLLSQKSSHSLNMSLSHVDKVLLGAFDTAVKLSIQVLFAGKTAKFKNLSQLVLETYKFDKDRRT